MECARCLRKVSEHQIIENKLVHNALWVFDLHREYEISIDVQRLLCFVDF